MRPLSLTALYQTTSSFYTKLNQTFEVGKESLMSERIVAMAGKLNKVLDRVEKVAKLIGFPVQIIPELVVPPRQARYVANTTDEVRAKATVAFGLSPVGVIYIERAAR